MLVTDFHSDDFNSYASVTDLREFAKSRGLDVPSDNQACEMLLIAAMDYLEVMHWKGKRVEPTQPLSWPRIGVTFEGYMIPPDEIPRRVIQAQCRLAVESQEIELLPSFEGGPQVTQEIVTGAVSVSYAEGTANNAPKFTWLSGLLRGLSSQSNSVKLVRG